MKKTDVGDANCTGTTEVQSAELRDANRRIRTLEQGVEVLRRAAATLPRRTCREMSYPLVCDLAADGSRRRYFVRLSLAKQVTLDLSARRLG